MRFLAGFGQAIRLAGRFFRTQLAFALLFATAVLAEEGADFADIVKVIASLNDGKRRPELQCDLSPAGAMPETTPPRITTRGIQFITSDVALVDAENTQYGSVVIVRRVPIVFVVKRVGIEWKIAATRTNCPEPRMR